MPSRCIFFFRALSAWSILLSRTMICKEDSCCHTWKAGVDNRRVLACKPWRMLENKRPQPLTTRILFSIRSRWSAFPRLRVKEGDWGRVPKRENDYQARVEIVLSDTR